MRLAAVMALAALSGKLPVDPGELLRRTPLGAAGGPLEKLTGDLRSQLIDAGKSVAMAAASDRIDSLSDKLQERADSMRAPGAKKGGRRPPDEGPRERPEPDEYEEYDEEYDEYEPEEPEGRGERRRPAAPARDEPRRRTPGPADEPAPRVRARR
jgi:hypothetical protein